MFKKYTGWIVLVFALAFGFQGITFAQDPRLTIVASYSILADVVANVAGDAAEVTTLMPVGTDPHTFTLVPADLARLAQADIVFVNGAFFEESLLEAIENAAPDLNIVEASACVAILPFGGHDHDHESEAQATPEAAPTESTLPDVLLPIAEQCATHSAEIGAIHADAQDPEAESDHDHEQGAHDAESLGTLYALDCTTPHEDETTAASAGVHDHAESGCDPHVWWQPHNVIYWTMTIRDTLSDLDPANASIYAANAAAYIAQVDALTHDEIRPLIETLPLERRIFVTDHDTLTYFAHAYDFEIVGVVVPGGSTLGEASASEIASLIDTIRAEGVSAIFVGSTVNPQLAEQIANETGVRVIALFTDSLSEADGAAPTYLDFMRYNVQTIVDALSE